MPPPRLAAWPGSTLDVSAVSLGVDSFGRSGTLRDPYAAHDLHAGSIANGRLVAPSL
jgi:pyruvate dehydrogenase complex dehydrogenase (E1) component